MYIISTRRSGTREELVGILKLAGSDLGRPRHESMETRLSGPPIITLHDIFH